MGKSGSSPQVGTGASAPPAPPPSLSQLEVTQAKIDAARQAKGRKGINSTIVAGQQPLGGAANGGGGNTLMQSAGAGAPKNNLLGGG